MTDKGIAIMEGANVPESDWGMLALNAQRRVNMTGEIYYPSLRSEAGRYAQIGGEAYAAKFDRDRERYAGGTFH